MIIEKDLKQCRLMLVIFYMVSFLTVFSVEAEAGYLGIYFQDNAKIDPKKALLAPQKRSVLMAGTSPVSMEIVAWGKNDLGDSLNQVLVTGIFKDSPAYKAGIVIGDLIVAINGKPVSTMSQVPTMLAVIDVGHEITITIRRQNKDKVLHAKLVNSDQIISTSQKVNQIEAEAMQQFQEGNLDAAIITYNKLLKKYSDLFGSNNVFLINTNLNIYYLAEIKNDLEKARETEQKVLYLSDNLFGKNTTGYNNVANKITSIKSAHQIRRFINSNYTKSSIVVSNIIDKIEPINNIDLKSNAETLNAILKQSNKDRFATDLRLKKFFDHMSNTDENRFYSNEIKTIDIGKIATIQNDFQKAITYFERSLNEESAHNLYPKEYFEKMVGLANAYAFVGSYDKSINTCKEAERKANQIYKKKNLDLALLFGNLSQTYYSALSTKKSENLYARSLELIDSDKDSDSKIKIRQKLTLFQKLYFVSYDHSNDQLERTLPEIEKIFGKYSIEYAKAVRIIANIKYSRPKKSSLNDDAKIKKLFEDSLSIQREIENLDVNDYIETLREYARFLSSRYKFKDSLPYYLEALAISTKYYGNPRSDISGELARHLSPIDYNLAMEILLTTIKTDEQQFGLYRINNSLNILRLANLCGQLSGANQSKCDADKYYTKYLYILKHIYGEGSLTYALSKQTVADHYFKVDKEKANILMQESYLVLKSFYNQNNMRIVNALEQYANRLIKTGNYIEAKKIYYDVVNKKERLLGKKDRQYQWAKGALAYLYQTTGDYQGAIEIYEEKNDLIKLSYAYSYLGQHQKALSILEKYDNQTTDSIQNTNFAFLNKGSEVSGTSSNESQQSMILEAYADTLLGIGNYKDALEYYHQSLDILKSGFPTIDVDSIPSIGSGKHFGLAKAYEGLGEFGMAESHYKQVLSVEEKGPPASYGPEGWVYATHMVGMAGLYNREGNWKQAENSLKKAIEIIESVLGNGNPEYATALMQHSLTYCGKGDTKEAFLKQVSSLKAQGEFIDRLEMWSDETLLQSYMVKLQNDYDLFYSLLSTYQSDLQANAEAALDIHLQYKGRVLDTLSKRSRLAILSKDPSILSDLQQLKTITARISQFHLNPPSDLTVEERKEFVTKLETKRLEIEESLVKSSSKFKKINAKQSVTSRQLVEKLSKDTVYVDFIDYKKYDYSERKWLDDRYYMAFVLIMDKNGDPIVKIKNIGATNSIDKTVEKLRIKLQNLDDADRGVAGVRIENKTNDRTEDREIEKRANEKLYSLLLAPFEDEISTAKSIVISPSGNLNTIPFEILKSSMNDRYICERFNITYNFGRDIVATDTEEKIVRKDTAKQQLFLVASPDFDNAVPEEVNIPTKPNNGMVALSRGSVNNWPILYDYLPGTSKEARNIQRLTSDLEVILIEGKDASESNVKQITSPKILHLATHGFFLEDTQNVLSKKFKYDHEREPAITETRLPSTAEILNPLLRSGLALAGANRLARNIPIKENEEDGILTAAEVAGMNLYGTDLVVLSACETGLGDIKRGEGVSGLRRSFKIAGARNVIMSLWNVPDKETSWLMEAFYKNYFSGDTPPLALNKAKFELRKRLIERDGLDHPYYWAAFIVEGSSF